MPQIPDPEFGENDPFSWRCPFCSGHTTINSNDISRLNHLLEIDNSQGDWVAESLFIVCPNTKCKKFALSVTLKNLRISEDQLRRWEYYDFYSKWDLIPESLAKTFPDYIPEVILTDYSEACLIQTKSPRASATLSRRCLQGILRDYWKVKPDTLFKEIEEIKDKVESSIWNAIDAVRKIGNIGAHMEKDINVIVEVDPEEADLLIQLIETLLEDWYVGREEKKNRVSKLIAMAASKEQERKSQKTQQDVIPKSSENSD
jgi:Domain of unknown function (DUF4145)